MIDPTDRSTLRVMMTTAWPTASSSSSEGLTRKLRQPSALKRKFSFFAVATTVTATSTMKMENSRERSRPVSMRRVGDIEEGWTSRTSLVLGSEPSVWVVGGCGVMTRPPRGGWRRT